MITTIGSDRIPVLAQGEFIAEAAKKWPLIGTALASEKRWLYLLYCEAELSVEEFMEGAEKEFGTVHEFLSVLAQN